MVNSHQINVPCMHQINSSVSKKGVPQLSTIEAYKADDEVMKSFVQKSAAVSFLTPSFVRVAWQGLQEEAPEVDGIDDFVNCFHNTCIRGQYRTQQWNYFDYNSPRTNNHIKGWHSWLKKIVGRWHPNITEIVAAMKKEQACTGMKMEQFESGAMQPARKKICRQRQKNYILIVFKMESIA